MADFPEKDWKDRPDYSTPVNAAALEDMERRLSEYAASEVASLAATVESRDGISFEITGTNSNGDPTEITYGDGAVLTLTYRTDQQVDETVLVYTGGRTVTTTYTYDAQGNPTGAVVS